MNIEFEILSRIIKSRRSTFPNTYKPGIISDTLIHFLIENASWAPNHKKTEPWRFILIKDHKKIELSEFLSAFYKSSTSAEAFDVLKMKKAGEKALQASAVLAICIHRSPESLLPAWEETAAVACAVQNLWLSCTALQLAGYWSTPKAIGSMKEFLGLSAVEECLGLFYLGWPSGEPTKSSRKSTQEILRIL